MRYWPKLLRMIMFNLYIGIYDGSEISKAQDRLTDMLQNLYSTCPQHREILRMIMSTVGRGGEGDVGQRIRDEILVIQVSSPSADSLVHFHLSKQLICLELWCFALWDMHKYNFLLFREIMTARVGWWKNGIRNYIITLALMMWWSARWNDTCNLFDGAGLFTLYIFMNDLFPYRHLLIIYKMILISMLTGAR